MIVMEPAMSHELESGRQSVYFIENHLLISSIASIVRLAEERYRSFLSN
jgi:hypothetical protein